MITASQFVNAIKGFQLPTVADIGDIFTSLNPWRKYQELVVELYTGAAMREAVSIYKEALVALELTDAQLEKMEAVVIRLAGLVDEKQFKEAAEKFVMKACDDNQALVPEAIGLLRKFNPSGLTLIVKELNRHVAARAAVTEAAKAAKAASSPEE
jgi:hypothetical protein